MAINKNHEVLTRRIYGSYYQSGKSYANCPNSDPDLNNDLGDLTNFVLVATYAQGYPGVAVTSGIEDADSRFFGSKGC